MPSPDEFPAPDGGDQVTGLLAHLTGEHSEGSST